MLSLWFCLLHTCACCFCVLSMLGSMLSGPSTLIISSFSLSHGPSWLAAEAKLPSLSAHVSSSVCLWAAVWLAVCQRESGELTNQDRSERCRMLMDVFIYFRGRLSNSIFIVTRFLSGFLPFMIKLYNMKVRLQYSVKISVIRNHISDADETKPNSMWRKLTKQLDIFFFCLSSYFFCPLLLLWLMFWASIWVCVCVFSPHGFEKALWNMKYIKAPFLDFTLNISVSALVKISSMRANK